MNNPQGRAGFIVPTGIATDDGTKEYFAEIATQGRLVSLFDFENRNEIFSGVHRSYKFSLITLGNQVHQADLLFFATQPNQIQHIDRRFNLSPSEFALINPNTRTCPVFRSKQDAELTKKLYGKAPVLIQEGIITDAEKNPWGIRFQAMFHMSGDSGLFWTLDQLSEMGADEHFEEPSWRQVGNQTFVPLYEAKMVHHYDHRWATYETNGEDSRDCELEEKQNPEYRSRPSLLG